MNPRKEADKQERQGQRAENRSIQRMVWVTLIMAVVFVGGLVALDYFHGGGLFAQHPTTTAGSKK